VLPGAAVMLGLSILSATLGQVPAIDGLFFGLKCAVLALVAQALLRIGARALKTRPAWCLAAAAFVALNVFAIPFPAVVAAGFLIGWVRQDWFRPGAHAGVKADTPGLLERALVADPSRLARQAPAARLAGVAALVMWLLPVAALRLLLPGRFADIAWFFSKMAVVTVGGAYAVLAYVAQDAVHFHHWLTAQEMLAGLGLAETTPGPLILVIQFVGFLAGARAPGSLHGIAGGVVASALTLWVTFLPCFAFVFLGAPLVERLAENRRLAASLAAITATVVGVIANLALWFGLRVLFAETVIHRAGPAAFELPVPASFQLAAACIAAVAAFLLFGLRRGVPLTLAVCAALGFATKIG
jgi:chromate transporter